MIYLSPACIERDTGKAYKIKFPTASKAHNFFFWMSYHEVDHLGDVVGLRLESWKKYKVQHEIYDHFGDKVETKKTDVPGDAVAYQFKTAKDGTPIDFRDKRSWAPPPPPVLVAEPCNAIDDLIDTECDYE